MTWQHSKGARQIHCGGRQILCGEMHRCKSDAKWPSHYWQDWTAPHGQVIFLLPYSFEEKRELFPPQEHRLTMIVFRAAFTRPCFRLVFGTTVMYVFYNPKEASSSGEQYPEITHEMAQEEIAANSGFDMNTENKSRGWWHFLFLDENKRMQVLRANWNSLAKETKCVPCTNRNGLQCQNTPTWKKDFRFVPRGTVVWFLTISQPILLSK